MNQLLEKIFETGTFTNRDNVTFKVNSFTSKDQCEFLQTLIKENNFKSSLEIGFAYGISTLAITEAMTLNGGSHTVIDKFEITGWNSDGLDLIKQAGYSVDFKEEWCYMALPELIKEKRKFDFVYVDSTKQFDWIAMNFFFIDKLLDISGIVVFDDSDKPGIRKVVRLISQYPSYKVVGQHPVNNKPSLMRRAASSLRFIPGINKLLRPDIVNSDYSQRINTSCTALRKIGEDNRSWDWHREF